MARCMLHTVDAFATRRNTVRWSLVLVVGSMVGCAAPRATPSELSPVAPFTPLRQTKDAPEAPPVDAPLDALLDHATRHHPRLRADHARWRAQTERIEAAGRWADPKVGYTFAPLPIETRLGANRHTVTVGQHIPWPTTTEADRDVAEAAARGLARRVDAAYVATRLELEQLYWSLYALDGEQRVLARELTLLGSLAAGLEARVEVGARPASELSRIALMQGKLADRIAGLDARRQALEAQLGRALGLPRAHRVAFPDDVPLSGAPPELDLEGALEGTPAPPHLRALAAEVARRQAERERVGLERLPNFEVGAQWAIIDAVEGVGGEEAGRDAVMLRVGVSVPLNTGATQARMDASEASVVEAQARLEGERQRWLADLRAAHARAWDAHRRIERLEKSLLVQARATFEMVRGDYEAERAEFGALLRAVGDIHELELALARSRADRERHIARWEALLGRPIVAPGETK